jgi:class 3 adenylate cyclase
MQSTGEADALATAIAVLDGQRALLGDAATDATLAPLRARLASLQRLTALAHRQVSVLFADVVGSTAMISGLDAEDTLGVLGAAMQRMAGLIAAQGGRVLKFTGDGVKAVFRMDQAREDDAEHAVRAGLAITAAGPELAAQACRQHGIGDFAVRVGVHTGDVALRAGVEAEQTMMGATVHIAQAHAHQPGHLVARARPVRCRAAAAAALEGRRGADAGRPRHGRAGPRAGGAPARPAGAGHAAGRSAPNYCSSSARTRPCCR